MGPASDIRAGGCQAAVSGLGADPDVACDLWRLDGDKIVEHWDGHQPWVAKNPSGRSMTDGPTRVSDRDRTADNKKVVEGFRRADHDGW
jgi:hypothetical protein